MYVMNDYLRGLLAQIDVEDLRKELEEEIQEELSEAYRQGWIEGGA